MLRRLAAGLLLSCFLALSAAAAAAPSLTPAQSSEDQAQHMRGAANAQAGANADQASLHRAAKDMEGVVAYLDSPAVRQQALGYFPLYVRNLVIDVRGNGGGSTAFGNQILAYLTRSPIPHAMSLRRDNDAGFRQGDMSPIVWTPPFDFPSGAVAHADVFTGKVAVLTGPRTFSAGEDFVLAFDALHRGITVGEATGGSTGQPLMFRLPGGGTARICAKLDLLPDGTPFVGRGLKPDIEAHASVQSIRSGADPVLDRALQALGGGELAGR